MWLVNGNNLQMSEDDFGVALSATFEGATLTVNDVLVFTFKDKPNGDVILEKEYTATNNTFEIVLTEAESKLFPPSKYVFSVAWCQSGSFRCYLVENGTFKVGDVA